MNRADKNAQAATDWAAKKKAQMERAKQIREERKMKGQGQVTEPIESYSRAPASKPFSSGGDDEYPPRDSYNRGGADMGGAPPSGSYDDYSGSQHKVYGGAGSNGFSRGKVYKPSNFSNDHMGYQNNKDNMK